MGKIRYLSDGALRYIKGRLDSIEKKVKELSTNKQENDITAPDVDIVNMQTNYFVVINNNNNRYCLITDRCVNEFIIIRNNNKLYHINIHCIKDDVGISNNIYNSDGDIIGSFYIDSNNNIKKLIININVLGININKEYDFYKFNTYNINKTDKVSICYRNGSDIRVTNELTINNIVNSLYVILDIFTYKLISFDPETNTILLKCVNIVDNIFDYSGFDIIINGDINNINGFYADYTNYIGHTGKHFNPDFDE